MHWQRKIYRFSNDEFSNRESESKRMQKKPNRIVGIDLGTTNSLVSYIQEGRPLIIPNERGSRTTPSVVCIKGDDEPEIIGEMARNQAVLNSEQTVANVKLAMGSERKYRLRQREYLPEEISGLILARLKENSEKYLDEEIHDAVITVPAYFDDQQRRATMRAAAMAGLKVRKLLNEPTAAALAYSCGSNRPDAKLLVVDLGGGTLDITLVEYKDRVFQVKAVGGSTTLGGVNFDRQIINHVVQDFKETHSCDLSHDKIAFQQLVIQSEKAKADLSSSMETTLMIPYISMTEKGPLHLNKILTRSVFEGLVASLLSEIKELILATFNKSNLRTDWVDSVILVGGSTRIPALETLILDIIDPHGKKQDLIKKAINQDEAVANGAAIMAGILSGELMDIEFHDITSHDLGILDHEDRFEVILSAGSIFPCEISKLFTTATDNQEEVVIRIVQKRGEKEASPLVSLGDFSLRVTGKRQKGGPDIDVSFAFDLNEMLTVSAVDLDTHEKAEINIE